MEKMDKGLTVSTKMGADSLVENAPIAPEFICPSPNVLDFNEKRLHWASVVHVWEGEKKVYIADIFYGLTNKCVQGLGIFPNKVSSLRWHCCNEGGHTVILKCFNIKEVCIPVFLDIHRHPKQKYFFKCYDAFFEIIQFIHFYSLF